jgi:glycosyltransferase involved in cell wall biosynthesis
MKVAFVTDYDGRDIQQWSGLGYFIAQALIGSGLELDYFSPLVVEPITRLRVNVKAAYQRAFRPGRYFRGHDALIARSYARQVDAKLAVRPDIDLIFSPGTIPIAFLKDRRPLVYWSDATHAAIFGFYPEYSNLCASSQSDGHAIEGAALGRAAAALFSSEWAAASARRDYRAPAERVHCIPFGANLEHPPSAQDVERSIQQRTRQRCRLLFLGVDWVRKGGALAVQVAEALNRGGLPTELTIVGCSPFPLGGVPPFMRLEGFLSKRQPAGEQRLRVLLAEHHFLIAPALAECYGLAFCEANAFGLPCLARHSGGVPTIICHGENGWLFDPAADAATYAAAIQAVFADRERYLIAARHARRHYELRLNWDVAGRRAADILYHCQATSPWRPRS